MSGIKLVSPGLNLIKLLGAYLGTSLSVNRLLRLNKLLKVSLDWALVILINMRLKLCEQLLVSELVYDQLKR